MLISNLNEDRNIPSFEEVFIKLLQSVAEEEMALANFISIEADKINVFAVENFNHASLKNTEVLEFNQSILRIIDSVMKRDWLLYKKLEMIFSFTEKVELHQCSESLRNIHVEKDQDYWAKADQNFVYKYKDIIINKQKFLSHHLLAVNTLMQNTNKSKIKKEHFLFIENTAEKIMNTVIELHSLQIKKLNLIKCPR
ncbi:hypothetical protein [Heyndrickxia acidicola]|uniref:Uncharacterized protein n=1 Tax=Heyndrickxia acidicola TaxID=209389 RepID=A0ABU6MIT8_9BACI|nr:hypothetical protein [Heyndrickxia acidicola]MED1204574.1 hypothetical protein [Heyndrickxia acidicola]